ncbi:LUD domain-containing protein [Marinilabilia sp.]|uniref:LutC/YkgG family protein n=1 Tax=Marinilabilia sp. TaxID=2021252 RepID=UPI0025BA2774|nr:LUD domain-containing protein [Marinilabilia sp.]
MNQKKRNNHSRSAILNRLRQTSDSYRSGVKVKTAPDGLVFPKVCDLLANFRDELEQLGGEVVLCDGVGDQMGCFNQLKEKRGWSTFACIDSGLKELLNFYGINGEQIDPVLDEVEVGVTRCEALVALTGSVMVSSMGGSGRRLNIFPSVHIVLAQKSQLVESIAEGFDVVGKKYTQPPSQISLISGPSRTADIEKTLVMGAHGPKELIVLVDTRN